MSQNIKQDIIQSAWDLFSKGDLAGAERAAAIAVQQLKNTAAAPIPDIMLLKAFYLCRLQRSEEARRLFGRVLEDCPDDAYAQEGYLLALRDQLSTEGQVGSHCSGNADSMRQSKDGILLLGAGTGRSGSTTLTRLWQKQESCYCTHEHPPRLSWDIGFRRLEFHKRRFDILRSRYQFVADVSHWWLPYLDRLMESYPEVRVVVLKREREATVNSFVKIKGGTGQGAINHWMKHDGKVWVSNSWDECYPTYGASSMRGAIERYWEEYYEIVESMVRRFPASIRVFSTERLSEAETQSDILSFCGFEAPQLVEDLHLNKGGATDGVRLY